MKNIIIAPVGDNMGALFVGLREFPTERIILLSPESMLDEAEKVKDDLDKFKISTKIIEIKGNIWEDIFAKVAEIKKLEKERDIIINTATGDRTTTCAATSAAFVNGLKAISVEGNEAMLLPVLKFSYYKILTDKKLNILDILYKENCCASLEELSKRANMSLPLISYHINGTLKSDGLKELGLVETIEKKGKMDIKLTTMGRLLIKGYVN